MLHQLAWGAAWLPAPLPLPSAPHSLMVLLLMELFHPTQVVSGARTRRGASGWFMMPGCAHALVDPAAIPVPAACPGWHHGRMLLEAQTR